MTDSHVDLVVAPLAAELRPFLRSIAARRREALPGGAVYSGRWKGRELLAAVIGDGAGLARRGLERVAELEPRRLLLVGVAGGLSPELGVGDTVRAGRVIEMSGGTAAREWRSPGGGGATVIAGERILGAAAEKQALWQGLGSPTPAVVDLESAVFVRAALGCGVDWAVIRAVSDEAAEDLPLDFAAASDAEGHVLRARVVSQLAARPGALAAVRQLRQRLTACAERLEKKALGWVEEGD